MKNSKIKLISLFTILCLNIFFVNIDGVRAVALDCPDSMTDSEGNLVYIDGDICYNAASVMEPGFAMCYYYLDVQVGMHNVAWTGPQVGDPAQYKKPIKRHIDFSIQVAKSAGTDSSGNQYYSAVISTKCSKEYIEGEEQGETNPSKQCQVGVRETRQLDALLANFYKSGKEKWECPSSIVVSYDYDHSKANPEWHGLTETIKFPPAGDAIATAYLWKDNSKQAGEANSQTNFDTGDNVNAGTSFNASSRELIENWGNYASGGNYYTFSDVGSACGALISGELSDMLNTIFWVISIAGIILLIVMTMISFIKAITGSDDEKLRDVLKHLWIRIIVVIILLLLPMLLGFVISIINNYTAGEVQIGEDGNVFCDVDK